MRSGSNDTPNGGAQIRTSHRSHRHRGPADWSHSEGSTGSMFNGTTTGAAALRILVLCLSQPCRLMSYEALQGAVEVGWGATGVLKRTGRRELSGPCRGTKRSKTRLSLMVDSAVPLPSCTFSIPTYPGQRRKGIIFEFAHLPSSNAITCPLKRPSSPFLLFGGQVLRLPLCQQGRLRALRPHASRVDDGRAQGTLRSEPSLSQRRRSHVSPV